MSIAISAVIGAALWRYAYDNALPTGSDCNSHSHVNVLELTNRPQAPMLPIRRSDAFGHKLKAPGYCGETDSAFAEISASGFTGPERHDNGGDMETIMHQSGDNLDTPRDFEAWRALLRSNCGGEVEVTEPNAFAGRMRPLSVSGLAAAAVKIQWGSAAADLGCTAQRVERTYRDVRRDGVDHYLIVYQVAGQSVLTQNDQAVQLAVGDVALVDATRPATYFTNCRGPQWLTLRLPRQSVLSHLGFELEGGLGRHGTRAARLLFDLVRDADKGDGSASSRADSYMQLAVYDLVGALFAPSDSEPVSRHTDKLFTRIRGIIKGRLADPDFGPSEVAAEAGISLRYVQKLCTARGTTCSEFIYSLRLDHVAHLMHRRALLGASRPLSDIAYACGFRDYSHFARKFRQRFGCAPGTHAGGHGHRVGRNRP